ncbi:6-phospho-beta-glucosidase [Paramicrobacterium chengjingii]|uniref:6-phospho-beta-glucosidase n=1 Tax=Paramicrobacterium chengjingii TaxID=2769067 RepID=A0ABX6YGA2_9MICO|nr:6-phospho-beta-glucosidase [Microbacterium chengjingii]QPZ37806.1 6-phospho-beta-glucosidase [Microbacterium chengjingii]
MKLAIIGGGSTYTPELIDGFIRYRDVLPLSEIWLYDPSEERRRLVGGMATRMLAASDHEAKVHATDDLVAAVSGADTVLIQLRIGGQDARKADEAWPHDACCIGQETTGPGGFAKALRTVPVVLEIANVIREHAAKDAWIVDFTNPVGIVTRALLNAGHRAVGLCNVAIGFQRRFAERLGVAPSHLTLGHVGLNHLSWERNVFVRDASGIVSDRLPELLDKHASWVADDVHLPEQLLRLQNAVPSYYLRYFYAHDIVLHEQRREPTRAEAVMEVERDLLAQYADEAVVTKPEALLRRGGAFYSEAAVELIASLRSDTGDTQVVNVRNDGAMPFLPDDHVIEVSASVSSRGLTALPIAPLEADKQGLVAHVAAYERLALDAATHGGRDRVLAAMMAHPLVQQYDRAEKLTDLLLSENAAYLPWLA